MYRPPEETRLRKTKSRLAFRAGRSRLTKIFPVKAKDLQSATYYYTKFQVILIWGFRFIVLTYKHVPHTHTHTDDVKKWSEYPLRRSTSSAQIIINSQHCCVFSSTFPQICVLEYCVLGTFMNTALIPGDFHQTFCYPGVLSWRLRCWSSHQQSTDENSVSHLFEMFVKQQSNFSLLFNYCVFLTSVNVNIHINISGTSITRGGFCASIVAFYAILRIFSRNVLVS